MLIVSWLISEAVVLELSGNMFGHRVGPGASGVVFACLDKFRDVNFSEDCGAHVVEKEPLFHLLRDGEGKELDVLSLIMFMIERGIGRRSSAGGVSDLA